MPEEKELKDFRVTLTYHIKELDAEQVQLLQEDALDWFDLNNAFGDVDSVNIEELT